MLKQITKNQFKIIINGVIVIVLLCQCIMTFKENSPRVFACDTEQECKAVVEASKQKRAALVEEQRSIEAKSAPLEEQVQNLANQLESYQTEIIVTSIELSKLKMQQEQLNINIESNKEKIKERLVSSQFSLETNTELNFIANSTSISDFIERMHIINDLSETDNELIRTLGEQIEQLKKIEEQQSAHLREVEKLTAEVESLKVAKKAELDKYLAEIQQKITEQQNQTNQSASSEQKLRELEEAKALAQQVATSNQNAPQPTPSQPGQPSQPTPPQPTPSPTPSAPASSNVITVAQKYLGVPYVWGGSTPRGFDCSGFTSYVYREATGKYIGRVTTNQENSGTVIPLSQAQPGDLLFWGGRGSTSHVAIYLGNNQYIHAPYSGRTIEVSNMSYFRPDFALRVS